MAIRSETSSLGKAGASRPLIDLPEPIKPVGTIAIHIAVGALAFVVVLSVAVALAVVVHLLAMVPFAPGWLQETAEPIEKGFFGVDLFLVGSFLLKEVGKYLRSLLKDWRDG